MKLPKSLPLEESDEEAASRFLKKHLAPLCATSTLAVPHLSITPGLTSALGVARRAGQLRGGLENIETILLREEVGLESASARLKVKPKARVSRILLMSNDGSDRFYRHCATLLERYSHRVMGLRLEASGQEFGQRFFGSGAVVKAALLCRKEFAAQVLAAVVSDGRLTSPE